MEENKKNEQTEKRNLFQRIGDGAKNACDEVKLFIHENPGAIPALLSAAGTIAFGLFRLCLKAAGDIDSCRIEDDITGADFLTTHPLCNREILELGDRMESGMSKGEALDDMGLLRKERKRRK